jgi:hypothetical protein
VVGSFPLEGAVCRAVARLKKIGTNVFDREVVDGQMTSLVEEFGPRAVNYHFSGKEHAYTLG